MGVPTVFVRVGLDTGITRRVRGGIFRVQNHPNLQFWRVKTRANQFLKMSEHITQGWQQLLMRNGRRLLLSPGGLSWCINLHARSHPIECRTNTTNEVRPLQHFCHFHRGTDYHSPQPLAWHK